VAAAAVIVLATLLKIVLMLVATPGIIAPAATATKPAIKAYSMRSWPRVSFQILSFKTKLVIRVILMSPFLPATNFLRHYEYVITEAGMITSVEALRTVMDSPLAYHSKVGLGIVLLAAIGRKRLHSDERGMNT
jgi:hypothetical protein